MSEKTTRAEQTAMDLSALNAQEDLSAIKEDEEINVFRPDDIPDEKKDLIRRHMLWLGTLRKEYPLPSTPYRIGVYIRYFNQTKHKDYLSYHKKEFENTISLCPRWTLVDFYVDKGPSAPNIESAPELCRLINDCMEGKVDLIITQKVSNMSRKVWDLTLIIRMLASRGIGIYFISEDIFTTASYYRQDMKDTGFLSESPGIFLADDEETVYLPGGNHVD